jgi:hypothetical protein
VSLGTELLRHKRHVPGVKKEMFPTRVDLGQW